MLSSSCEPVQICTDPDRYSRICQKFNSYNSLNSYIEWLKLNSYQLKKYKYSFEIEITAQTTKNGGSFVKLYGVTNI